MVAVIAMADTQLFSIWFGLTPAPDQLRMKTDDDDVLPPVWYLPTRSSTVPAPRLVNVHRLNTG